MLAQVRLVREAAQQRDVAQGRIGRQHVVSGQFDATAHYESMRRLIERTLEAAGEMRFAQLNEPAQMRDKYWPGDVTLDEVTYLACLPCQEAPLSVRIRFCNLGMGPLTQQRGRSKYRVMDRVSVIELTRSCIKQRDHVEYQFRRVCRAGPRIG